MAATQFLIDEKGFFPTGLLARIKKWLIEYRIQFQVADNRIKPDKYTINLVNKMGEPEAYYEQVMGSNAIAQNDCGILEMPTGIGKTRTIKEALLKTQRPTLVITPSSNLKTQTCNYLLECFGSSHVSLMDKKHTKPIVVTNYHAVEKMPPDYFKQFHQVIFDEFHNCLVGKTKIECKSRPLPIEDIYRLFFKSKKGIFVKSWNGSEFEYKKVKDVFRYKAPTKVFKIKCIDESGKRTEFTVTGEHKIFQEGKKVLAKDLKVGQELYIDYTTAKQVTRNRLKNPQYIKSLSERAIRSNLNRSKEVKDKQSLKMKEHVTSGRIKAFGRGKYGNGQQITPTQSYLSELFLDFTLELQVNLKDNQYPGWYKIDLANDKLKIGIEVDGTSHKGREESDNRKDMRLGNLGWTFLRIPENYVEQELNQLKKLIQQKSGSMI
jgi:very-short-patch-repair endonuclease